MTEKNIMTYALSSEPWAPTEADVGTQGQRSTGFGKAFAAGVLILGASAAVLAEVTGHLDFTGPPEDPNNRGFDLLGRPIVRFLPPTPFDPNAAVMNGDGVAQRGEPIGKSGELASDLERKQQLVKELVPVYQKAFAGPEWEEVSECPGCARGFSAQPVGTNCLGCGSPLTKEAYPADELYASLLSRTADPDSVVYVERLPNGKPVLGAILKDMSEEEVLNKYTGADGRPRISEQDWDMMGRKLPARVVWLDEIFADLDARPNGNLTNLQEVLEKSAQKLGENTVALRTTNPNLIQKIIGIYGDRAEIITVPDTGTKSGTSSLIIIKLR